MEPQSQKSYLFAKPYLSLSFRLDDRGANGLELIETPFPYPIREHRAGRGELQGGVVTPAASRRRFCGHTLSKKLDEPLTTPRRPG